MTLGTIRGALLAASALVVLSAGPGYSSAPHRIAHGAANRALSVLHDQTKNDSGFGTVSQASGEFSAQAADDFTVSDNTVWTIKEIDVIGVYFNGSGPPKNVDVIFYKNAHHKPGAFKAGGTFPIKKDNSGSFVIDLGKNGLKFKPGHYWVSVVANMDFGGGQWNWENQTSGTGQGDPAVWQNPSGGGTCTTWTVESKCGFGSLGDHMFALRGSVKIKIK